MTRADAIEWIKLIKDRYYGKIDIPPDRLEAEALDMAIAALREQDATDTNVGHKNEWISVDERLPEDGVRVLTACDDGLVRLGISKGGFSAVVNRSHRFSYVTHWMPLPSAPKEDNNG